MSLKLMYITNQTHIAKLAEESGVDWIFVDLELNGKLERQGHLDTVISRHRIEDVKKIKKVLKKSELLVRVNPIHDNTTEEINKVIEHGADIIMLPFFKTKNEVEEFIKVVGGRAAVCLLFETKEAVDEIDSILSLEGIDYIHIGLNDLHLSYSMKFMFELLTNGVVEKLCKKFFDKGIPFGFGGIAQLGKGTLPAENVIIEHYRLDSSMVILSRSFYNVEGKKVTKAIEQEFKSGVEEIRKFELNLKDKSHIFFEDNKNIIKTKVDEVVNVIAR